MKRRFRKVVRQGWHVVHMNRANLWNWEHAPEDRYMGDAAHYKHIREWCSKSFDKNSWEGRLLPNAWWKDTGGQAVTKEFAFKNEKDKTLFILRWL